MNEWFSLCIVHVFTMDDFVYIGGFFWDIRG